MTTHHLGKFACIGMLPLMQNMFVCVLTRITLSSQKQIAEYFSLLQATYQPKRKKLRLILST